MIILSFVTPAWYHFAEVCGGLDLIQNIKGKKERRKKERRNIGERKQKKNFIWKWTLQTTSNKRKKSTLKKKQREWGKERIFLERTWNIQFENRKNGNWETKIQQSYNKVLKTKKKIRYFIQHPRAWHQSFTPPPKDDDAYLEVQANGAEKSPQT